MDAHAVQVSGLSAYELMGRAGAAAWALLRQRWPKAQRLAVACGPGNNGGDGYVLARLIKAAGLDVQVFVAQPPRTPEADRACRDWREAGGGVRMFEGVLPEADLWIDALYGLGLSGEPEGAARAMIEAINATGLPVLALDLPSGLDVDRGSPAGVCIRADTTLTFIAAKRGLYTGPAREWAGEVLLDRLGLASSLFGHFYPCARWYRAEHLRQDLAPRSANAHKGDFGHVLCVGGDDGFGGAVRLCAEAALRVGAGLTSVATRVAAADALLAARPEVMARAVAGADELGPMIERANVLAVGPGLGQGEWGRALFEAALASGKPTVLDADGLNLLAADPRPLPQAILTPHPGEAGRLLGIASAEVQADRFAAIEALVERYGCPVILKGAGTLVAAPGETLAVIGAGNPGMATGGMGDVLTGVVAGLSAQGLTGFKAAVFGALLHAAAGDAAARSDGERGLLASNLFPHLRRAANPS
jgi:NAD(P)H-hydrate epimerase